MKKHSNKIIVFNFLLLMGYFAYSVVKKETLLEEGTVTLLELAPVDPRSLMQGDYMTLRYAIGEDLENDSVPNRGFLVFRDSAGIAKKIRLQEHEKPLHKGEKLLRFSHPTWRIQFGAESYFFQEGEAAKFEKAKFGGLKIDPDGNSLLIGLYDEKKKKIQ